MGSKKKTTVVNETGIGDDQFATLSAGQEGISGQVTDLGTSLDTRADSIDDSIGTGFDNMGGRLDTVDSSLDTLGTDMSSGYRYK